MKYVKERQIYTYSTVDQCRQETWKGPIGHKWIDTNKGDNEHPAYRSRLVATEFQINKKESIFAATPPLESLRILLAIMASRDPGASPPGKKPFKMMLIDAPSVHQAPAGRSEGWRWKDMWAAPAHHVRHT
eukprot:4289826-Karenia_brevis.AAC.1